jgi:HSP20 family protein
MSGTSLQPQPPYRAMIRRQEDGDPFMPFRRQMNRLFDDFFTGPMLPRLPMAAPGPVLEVVVTPQIEVSETEKEVQVTAELPGIDPNNVEVSLADDVLTIRGEKQQQQKSDQEQGRDYHLTERSYGTFARYLRLPFHADPGKIQASFKDGVLTVVIPKPEEMQQKVHRIPVATDGSQQAEGAPAQQAPQAQAAE